MKLWMLGCLAASFLGVAHAADTPSGVLAPALEGRIWDVAARQFISVQSAYQRAATSRYVLLGEKHDSEAHHARQLKMLQALDALAIAFVEVQDGKPTPADYDSAGFDLLWFTAATPRPDPCATPLTGSVATPNPISNPKEMQ